MTKNREKRVNLKTASNKLECMVTDQKGGGGGETWEGELRIKRVNSNSVSQDSLDSSVTETPFKVIILTKVPGRGMIISQGHWPIPKPVTVAENIVL